MEICGKWKHYEALPLKKKACYFGFARYRGKWLSNSCTLNLAWHALHAPGKASRAELLSKMGEAGTKAVDKTTNPCDDNEIPEYIWEKVGKTFKSLKGELESRTHESEVIMKTRTIFAGTH